MTHSHLDAKRPDINNGAWSKSYAITYGNIKEQYGKRREIVGLTGHTLLKALTNHNLIDPASHRLEDIDACSAECEVNIAGEWFDKLPEPSYDEKYVLKRNARNRVLNKHSRLGCQVVLTQEMQGMVVAVPEPKAWDTP
ncbi:beta-grasp domain-containing protein [Artemisia annua]|uniref:Beta-grasp domain-containing protein n=1 Tax=Artemisia annua TaxID=35608 RepID=A0A2U1NUW5_ARTAN|nr:beta-grasp domain-containing protein [Artemisia annua]